MDHRDWEVVKDLLADLVPLDEAERQRYLDDRCPKPAIRREVEDLLAHAGSSDRDGIFHVSQPGDQPLSLPIGGHVGPYEIIEFIGAGGMGEVFKARDTRLRRDVAIKALRSTPGSEAYSRVIREARATAQVNHPNVAEVYDVAEQDGRAFLIMEYVDGETLADRLQSRRPALAEAISIIRQVLSALAVSHRRGIVHRDLKPANLQITAAGQVKVLDFGIAQAAVGPSTALWDSAHLLTVSRNVGAGTPLYMAPEQLLATGCDERSDLYSAGIILFELITGHRPFSDAAIRDTEAVLRRTAPDPREIQPRVPRAIGTIVQHALQPEPSRRYQAAEDFDAALAAVANGTSWRSTRTLILKPLGDLFHSTPAPFRLIAALLAFTLASGVWMSRVRGTAQSHLPIVAVLPLHSDASGDSEYVFSGLAEAITSELVSVNGISVVQATAQRTERGRPDDVAVARTLGLDYAITGTSSATASRQQLTLGILDVKNRRVISSRVFDATTVDDALKLQSEATDWALQQTAAVLRVGIQRPGPAAMVTHDVRALEEYAQGKRFLERRDIDGDIDKAIAAFSRAIAGDARFASAHAALGEAYWQQYQITRDPAAAIRAKDSILEALRLDANRPFVRYTLALVYQGTGRSREAVDELQKAVQQQPASDDFHRLLGRIYAEQGQPDAAARELLAAIRLRPGYWENYRALGLVYYDAGRYLDAIDVLKRLTELQPDSPVGFQMLGTAYHAIGILDKALENYQRANALRPSAPAWSNIGTIRYKQRNFSDAVAAYRESARLQPKEPATFRNLGDALSRLNDAEAATEAYNTAIELCRQRLMVNPQDARALALEAICEAKIRHYDTANRLIDAATVIVQSGPILYQKAVVLALQGQIDPALNALEAAVSKNYSRVVAAEDEDLAILHRSPRFASLVAAPSSGNK